MFGTMVMTFGAVGGAVVIDEGPDCRCLTGRPPRPVQPLEYPPIIAAREDNLARFYVRGRTVAVDPDRGIDGGDSCRWRCSGSCWSGSRASSGGREAPCFGDPDGDAAVARADGFDHPCTAGGSREHRVGSAILEADSGKRRVRPGGRVEAGPRPVSARRRVEGVKQTSR